VFCPSCGGELFKEAAYCHKCGRKFPPQQPISESQLDVQRSAQWPRNKHNKKKLLAALQREAVNLNRCHKCSADEELIQVDFGLAMVRTGRNWPETVASVVFSAVSLSLGGYGIIRLPRKRTEVDVIPLKFYICFDCFAAGIDLQNIEFSLHPWFHLL
jgi:hypothetical protein